MESVRYRSTSDNAGLYCNSNGLKWLRYSPLPKRYRSRLFDFFAIGVDSAAGRNSESAVDRINSLNMNW